MKKIFLLLVLVLPQMAFAYPEWMSDAFTQRYGDCKTNNLAFSALRVNKMDLHKKYEDKDVYLRLVLFLQQDGSYSLRLNEQALIGCSTSSSGEEVCSYKILTDSWKSGAWSFEGTALKIEGLGIMTKESDVRYRDYQIHFAKEFPWAQVADLSFKGPLILVNFDRTGKNTAVICRQP